MNTANHKIKRLNSHLINQIAAGEVVERPAAIVKELIENSIDAGATKIDAEIEEGGKTRIIIKDNGFGISKEDIPLAFERHATSKLEKEDLFDIHTFGFRGEAVPSIAAVSKFELSSRTRENEHGWRINVSAGQNSEIYACPHPIGTSIKVEDLFFATPARLKFLKSDAYELASIKETFIKLCMANHNIHFTLRSNNKLIFDFSPTNFTTRIAKAMGGDFFENSTSILYERNNYKIEGMISLPTYSKSQSNSQYIYVNRRWVKDKNVSSIMRIAYQDMLMNGRYPMGVLFLTLDSREVDVNVHPAKTEVRFRDAQEVRNFLISSIKQSLNANQHTAAPAYAHLALQKFSSSTKDYSKQNIALQSTFAKNLPLSRPILKNDYLPHNTLKKQASITNYDVEKKENIDIDENFLGIAKAQIFNTFIIAQTEKALLLIDQHAAHERIIYEQLKNNFANESKIKSQTLLTPLYLNLQESDFEIFINNSELFIKMGFIIDTYPPNTLVIHAVPNIEGLDRYDEIMRDILSDIKELGSEVSATEAIWKKLSTCACHNSIRAGKIMNLAEMNELLRQMEKTEKSAMCNHGRPTYIELDKKSLEKLFER